MSVHACRSPFDLQLLTRALRFTITIVALTSCASCMDLHNGHYVTSSPQKYSNHTHKHCQVCVCRKQTTFIRVAQNVIAESKPYVCIHMKPCLYHIYYIQRYDPFCDSSRKIIHGLHVWVVCYAGHFFCTSLCNIRTTNYYL